MPLWSDERIAQAAQEAADEWAKDVGTNIFEVCKKQLELMRAECEELLSKHQIEPENT